MSALIGSVNAAVSMPVPCGWNPKALCRASKSSAAVAIWGEVPAKLRFGRSAQGATMATFTVRQGKRYRATISLGWLERLAGNDTIAGKLREAGFSEIKVEGAGATRHAEARWPGPDTTGEMPSQITDVTEIIEV